MNLDLKFCPMVVLATLKMSNGSDHDLGTYMKRKIIKTRMNLSMLNSVQNQYKRSNGLILSRSMKKQYIKFGSIAVLDLLKK